MLVALVLAAFAGSCDFASAFQRYCANNPRCLTDAGAIDAGMIDAQAAGDAADANNGPPIPPPTNCGPSGGCATPSQVCHPFGQVCMNLCNTSADCPPYLDTCVEIRDPAGNVRTPKVCTCTSAQVCNTYSAGFTCNPADSLCEPLCASGGDCAMYQPPRFCDQLSGLCQSTIPSCSSGADCSPGQPRCDPVTLRCTGCVTDSDCSGRLDGLVTCGVSGSCVVP